MSARDSKITEPLSARAARLALAGPHLTVFAETGATVYPLPARGSWTLGRDPVCELRVDDASVSRRHARLEFGRTLWLQDLDSANGTGVRGKRLAKGERVAVAAGDIINLGAVLITVSGVGTPTRAAVEGQPGSAEKASRPVIADPTMEAIHQLIARVAPSEIPVLILGETGVGKESVARALHERSGRAGPFLAINCGALVDTLLEVELFGSEKGAFTGAVSRPGVFEAAPHGTLFLDEIGDMPAPLQTKLLRVLEEKQVTRVGAVRPVAVDARIVSATHRDLSEEVSSGRFRQDLFFRIEGITLAVPPLRERPTELEPLARAFLPAGKTFSPEAIEALKRHAWPGNIRELRNAIARAAVVADDLILPRHLGLEAPQKTEGLRSELESVERRRVLEILERCGGNQSRAAAELGIARGTLLARLDKWGIQRPRKKTPGAR